jgi:predicted RNase H-like nuclease (RuvC/YqgF family)
MTEKEFADRLHEIRQIAERKERKRAMLSGELSEVEREIENVRREMHILMEEYCQGRHRFECVYSDYYTNIYKCNKCGLEG